MSYQDKVVIITGGSHGIGEGCVRAFVAAGAKVVFCARNDRDGERLAAEVNASGPGEAQFIRCDVSKVEEIQSLIDETVERAAVKHSEGHAAMPREAERPPLSRATRERPPRCSCAL